MEWRFNGRHGLFLDLAGIMSSFFSLFTFILNLPFKISFISFSAPQYSEELVHNVLKQRGGISVGRLECTGWNGT